MGLDLTAIVAQIVNFAVLVWLLRRVLYGPVKNLMAARAERLRRDMERVEELAAKAREAEARYRELAAQLERERARLLDEAREEARRERDRLLSEAAAEAQAARRQFAESWAAERRELQAALEANLVRQVCETSARVVAQLSGMVLADAIIATLEARWEQQAAAAAEGLPPAGAVGGGRVVVRTSFPPTPQQKERLAALARRLAARGPAGDAAQPGTEGPSGRVGAGNGRPEGTAADELPVLVEFVIDRELGLGVELESGGVAIGWSARDMLDDLRRDALAALDQASGASGGGSGPGEVTTGA